MAPPEYTERILAGEAVYLAPNGRFHRAHCRYFLAPGPDAVFIEGPFMPAFLQNHCKLCLPDGLPAAAGMAQAQATPADVPSAPQAAEPFAPSSPPADALGTAGPLAATEAFSPAGPVAPAEPLSTILPPVPPGTDGAFEPERVRKRKRDHGGGGRPPKINRVQLAAFTAIVLLSVAFFLLFTWLQRSFT